MPKVDQAEAITIAEAVVARLNAGSEAGDFSKTFVAERLYDPEFDLRTLKDVRVTVVCSRVDQVRLNRAGVQERTYAIQIGIQAKTDRSKADLDELMKVPQEIADYFDTAELGLAVFPASSIAPIYSPEHLKEFGAFTSVVHLTAKTVH